MRILLPILYVESLTKLYETPSPEQSFLYGSVAIRYIDEHTSVCEIEYEICIHSVICIQDLVF